MYMPKIKSREKLNLISRFTQPLRKRFRAQTGRPKIDEKILRVRRSPRGFRGLAVSHFSNQYAVQAQRFMHRRRRHLFFALFLFRISSSSSFSGNLYSHFDLLAEKPHPGNHQSRKLWRVPTYGEGKEFSSIQGYLLEKKLPSKEEKKRQGTKEFEQIDGVLKDSLTRTFRPYLNAKKLSAQRVDFNFLQEKRLFFPTLKLFPLTKRMQVRLLTQMGYFLQFFFHFTKNLNKYSSNIFGEKKVFSQIQKNLNFQFFFGSERQKVKNSIFRRRVCQNFNRIGAVANMKFEAGKWRRREG